MTSVGTKVLHFGPTILGSFREKRGSAELPPTYAAWWWRDASVAVLIPNGRPLRPPLRPKPKTNTDHRHLFTQSHVLKSDGPVLTMVALSS